MQGRQGPASAPRAHLNPRVIVVKTSNHAPKLPLRAFLYPAHPLGVLRETFVLKGAMLAELWRPAIPSHVLWTCFRGDNPDPDSVGPRQIAATVAGFPDDAVIFRRDVRSVSTDPRGRGDFRRLSMFETRSLGNDPRASAGGHRVRRCALAAMPGNAYPLALGDPHR